MNQPPLPDTNDQNNPAPPAPTSDPTIQVAVGDITNSAAVAIGQHITQQVQVTIHQLADLETHPPTPGDPPYKGLAYYDQTDEAIFYGRHTLAADLVATITAHRFVAIVGGSGSGKSSLLRAGVLPTLARQGWRIESSAPPANQRNNPGICQIPGLFQLRPPSSSSTSSRRSSPSPKTTRPTAPLSPISSPPATSAMSSSSCAPTSTTASPTSTASLPPSPPNRSTSPP